MIKTYILSLRPAKLCQTLMRPFMLLALNHTALDAYNNASAACLRSVRRLLQVIKVKFLFHDIHMRKLMTIFQILATLPVTKTSLARSFS